MKSEWMEIITLIPAMLFVGVLLALMLFPIVWMVLFLVKLIM